MIALAFASIRYRVTVFAACFLNLFLGAAVLTGFASLVDTAGGAGVSPADRSTLVTIAGVVGGWGLLVVAFGATSTLGLAVRQREPELALLKAAGALPGQVGQMVMGEAAIVAGLACLPAVPVGWVLGHELVRTLARHGEIASGVPSRFGEWALALGPGDMVLAALLAALITGRRSARSSVRSALTTTSAPSWQISWSRMVAGGVALLLGVDAAVLSATVLRGTEFGAESAAGEAAIWTSIGFALLAPAFLRAAEWLAGPVLDRLGVTGELAGLSLRQRPREAAGVAVPVIMFVGLSAGALALQRIQDRAVTAGHRARTADERGVELLNLVIIGLLAVFAAVVLVNLVIAATSARRAEFGQLRRLGATKKQVLRMIATESVVTSVIGGILGVVAALVGAAAYQLALTRTPRPEVSPGLYLAVLAAAVVLTWVTNVASAARALRGSVGSI